MSAKIKYFADTPMPEALQILRRFHACNKAIVFYEECSKTLLDMVISTPHQEWVHWYLIMLGAETEPELREHLIHKITDSMMAFKLYLDLDWLTDGEDRLLEEKFKGKLPTPERQLADGSLKRAKWQ